jgi:3-phenylpropionate/trans-cinnamate dioxygenase ferredoxin reductase subunit
VELLSGTSVMSVDLAARTARLQTKEEVEFSKAVFATGARVNILHHLEGAQLDGIHYLRVLGNSEAIREEAAEAEHVVLIGGSYIASEVAASLTAKGTRCTMVMLEDVALSRAFGEGVGRYFHDILASNGVDLVTGEELEAFLGEGRVRAIRTKSGREVEGDVVVVGAGVHPDTMLAERAGLKVDNGILCDAKLETSAEGIFAAGDVCSYDSVVHGRRLRVEHWDVALQQGQHAGRVLLGEAEPYRVVPYFFSDLADWTSLEYVGPAERWDELVWRGDRDAGEFSAWYLEAGRVAAALSVGRSEDLAHARRLIESGADVSGDRDTLADADSDLDDIGGQG